MAVTSPGPAAPNLLDHSRVDWEHVRSTSYLIHQHLRYDYPGPIKDLRHQLVVMPPERHGDQRRRREQVRVSVPARVDTRTDDFGNTVIELGVRRLARAIEFDVWIEVERAAPAGRQTVPESVLADPRLLAPSALTRPSAALAEAAAEIARGGQQGLALASDVNRWVHRRLVYEFGQTSIRTGADEALELGRGVCQDYAHVMIAICRLLGLPARYVSGHLLGEGGTHAWVEVLGRGPAGGAAAWAFDPTHGRAVGLSYVTVAVGRDYLDVAPTSGTFRAPHRGRLTARKLVGLTAVGYLE